MKSKPTPSQTVLEYGLGASPYGQCLWGQIDQRLAWLSFVNTSKTEALKALQSTYQGYVFQENKRLAHVWSDRIFSPSKSNSSWELHLEGTPFQLSVWLELMKIPCGKTVTYQHIAQAIGKPKAIRAVGTAVGQNKIAYVLPCHRVIRTDGSLGGYAWGEKLKAKLLQVEHSRCE